MYRKLFQRALVIAAVTVAYLMSHTQTWAQKGGKVGGGASPPARFTVLELPLSGFPNCLSDPNSQGMVTVAVDSSEQGYVSAAFARIDRTRRTVLSSGFLPEPPFVDPNDGRLINGFSGTGDVNLSGKICGHAGAFDPNALGDPNPVRAVLWSNNGSDYSCELLPVPIGTTLSYALGMNNLGAMVGFVQSDDALAAAVLWEPGTHHMVDLNTANTIAAGWALTWAQDINDAGLIVGDGYLNGVYRGFVLDRQFGFIWPVPLIGPATMNDAFRLSEDGRVLGQAWNGEGRHYGVDPDYVQGFLWAGPGASPVTLTPANLNTSLATGLNDWGLSVGNSYIPVENQYYAPAIPTLWEFDIHGNLQSIDLQTQINSKSPYSLRLAFDINNDGWISVQSHKYLKGKYTSPAVLLVPTAN